jgi:hypothetical protein
MNPVAGKFPSISSAFAPLIWASCIGFVIVVAMPTPAPALKGYHNLGGTHTAHEIKLQCDAAGGLYVGASKSNGGHYGCDVNGGGAVYCSKNGKCEGTNPARHVPGADKRPLGEVLTTKPTTNGTGGSRLDAVKERLRHAQTTKVTASSDPRKTPQGAVNTDHPTTQGSKDTRHQPAHGGERH